MSEYPLTIRHVLDDEWMETLVEMAGYGIGYWAQKAEVGDGTYTVWWDDSGAHRKQVTFGALARAVQRILSDDDVNVAQRYVDAVSRSVYDPGEIDAEVADIVVQVAVLGNLIYG